MLNKGFHYYSRFQTARGGLNTLPPFARSIVMFLALPGIVLLVLSIVLGLVSIFVLLLLTVPVYRVLQAVFGGRQPMAETGLTENPFASLFGQMPVGDQPVPGRKQVDAKVTDAQ